MKSANKRIQFGAKGSIGQDSSSWLVFEFKCPASEKTLKASPLGTNFKGLRKVVPNLCCSSEVDPIYFIMLCFSIFKKVRLTVLYNV